MNLAQLTALPGMTPDSAARWIDPLTNAMVEFAIIGTMRQAMFMAQVVHETAGLRKLREDLMYSAPVLERVFGKYIRRDELNAFAYQPARIANRAYANRMGNGDELSGDGYKYRGGGGIHTTGRSNFRVGGMALGVPLELAPELSEDPATAARLGAWEWFSRDCNVHADRGEFTFISRSINGGDNGLDARKAAFRVAGAAFGLSADYINKVLE